MKRSAVRIAVFVILSTVLFLVSRSAHALPTYSRQYGVACATCHTVAPNLNAMGRAFQANYFRFAAIAGSTKSKSPLANVPISGLTTFSGANNQSLGTTAPADFRTLELYGTGSFPLQGGRTGGGYFVDWVAANRDGRGGDLGDAWVAVPMAGQRGQLALVAGQFTPMMFQYDPINSLSQSLPAGIDVDANGISFLAPTPGLKLDWFDHRGQSTADGNYVSVGVPFGGHLTLDHESRLYQSNGAFVHAFRRTGPASLGGYGYTKGDSHIEGLLGTYDLRPNLSLLAAGTRGHDEFGTRRGFSLEANYTPKPLLGVTGRLESVDGDEKDTFPVAAVTFYPFGPGAIRFTGETIQQKGQRSYSIYGFLQF